MGHTSNTPSRRWISRLAPSLLALLAVPLMAPTCGGGQPGVKAFSKGSIIIPMDACYQNTPTTLTNTTYFTPYSGCPSNGATVSDHGNVLRAYGLVYQLLRNNIPVYWVINDAKTPTGAAPSYLVDPTNPDISLTYSNGAPVGEYVWASNTVGVMPPNTPAGTHTIAYHGGPFVVDGSDYTAATAVMQSLRTTFQGVNVHVSNVAFQANVAKSMSGGFQNSGGANPPPVALLNITGGDGKNSEVVIQGYLVDAGLGPTDFPGAGGTATPTGHGKIYDDLYPADFLAVSCTTTCANGSPCVAGKCSPSLTYFGYSVLWVPHWYAPGSAGVPAGFSYTDILTAIRSYMNAGHDTMAECAGLGSFEGVNSGNGSNWSFTFPPGTPAPPTQAQTTSGVWVNQVALDTSGAKYWGNYASPFLQIGDFPFTPVTGAIQQYSPTAAYVTRPAGFQLLRLISDKTDSTKDYFSVLPAYSGTGTVVYLAGHDFSGGQGAATQIAGSRLVLNTLFNLGNACSASGAACNTGKLGVCAAGHMTCCGPTDTACTVGAVYCKQDVLPGAEICDGLDNDCNGLVDDNVTDYPVAGSYPANTGAHPDCFTATATAFTAPSICRPGKWVCQQPYSAAQPWACIGQVTPQLEVCNGLDDNCNGVVDDLPVQSCYTGPAGTLGVGACTAGTLQCAAGGTVACVGQVLPSADTCEPVTDNDCNGTKGDGCGCVYVAGSPATLPCYTGPAGTAGVGPCRAGTKTCQSNGTWSACAGEVVPKTEVCGNGVDDDCNGLVDDSCVACTSGQTQPCYDGAASDLTAPSTVCRSGVRTCVNGAWGATCDGEILPATQELCNGKNDTCSAGWIPASESSASCGIGFTCVNGSCVESSCGVEMLPCPAGYTCDATLKCAAQCPSGGTCAYANCTGGVVPCPVGQVCVSGACSDPCQGKTCGPGTYCSGGVCVGGDCTAAGCPTGQTCQQGACAADPCLSMTCPSGTFCRAGDCVQNCAFVRCAAGQRCGIDGFCVADPCGGACTGSQVCQNGTCVADPCAAVSCGNLACVGGTCVPNPCAGVTCPVGVCKGGQCYSKANPTGAGGVGGPPPGGSSSSGGGCGSTGADGGPLAVLLGALALPFARRRRFRPGPGALALLLAAATVLSTGCSKSSKQKTCSPTCTGPDCVDVTTDPANCGACGHACSQGQICVDGICGPGSPVAPYLSAAAPSPAPASAITLQLTGERFQAGASLRVTGTPPPPAPTGVQVTDATHMSAGLDLGGTQPTTLQLRARNPDLVISNSLALPVAIPTPHVDSISPATAVANSASFTVQVTGSGFIAGSAQVEGSICKISSPSYGEQGLVTTYGSATSLQCQLNPSGFPPGSYSFVVVSGGTARSNPVTFVVTSLQPTVSSFSPSTGVAESVLTLVVTGTNFDPSTVVRFGSTALPTTFLDPAHVFSSLSLSGVAPGAYPISAANGTLIATATGQFTVTASPPQAVSLTPQTVRQGDTVTLDMMGLSFDATSGSGLTVVPKGSSPTGVPPLTTIITPTEAKATYVGGTPGAYDVRFHSAGAGADTAPLPLQVVSNAATLVSASPSGGRQGTTVASLVVTGYNLVAGVSLHIDGTGRADVYTAPALAFAPPNTLTLSNVSLAGWGTGSYDLTAWNPAAGASNKITFTVLPGVPTLTGVSPSTLQQGQTGAACAAPPVCTVTLTGTNFAGAPAPSVVQVESSTVQGGLVYVLGTCPAPAGVPGCIASVNAAGTSMAIALDTTGAVPATYSVTVVNPGALTSNAVSFTLTP